MVTDSRNYGHPSEFNDPQFFTVGVAQMLDDRKPEKLTILRVVITLMTLI